MKHENIKWVRAYYLPDSPKVQHCVDTVFEEMSDSLVRQGKEAKRTVLNCLISNLIINQRKYKLLFFDNNLNA
jgi:hypothetical protein